MIGVIKRIVVDNYKMFTDETGFKFSNRTTIRGRNGVGKTTLLGVFPWVVTNKTIDNKSNPDVSPIVDDRAEHKAIVCMDIDGVNYTICRTQTVKENGSTSNSYEIDGVPTTDKEFKNWWAERGVTADLLTCLTNPNVFVGQKKDDCRAILLKMGDGVSAEDVVKGADGLTELKALMFGEKPMTLEQVSLVANNNKKKVEKVHGKKGEITSTKLSCLQALKVELTKRAGTKTAQAVVDDMITECKDMQAKYEQEKADAERLLFQIEQATNLHIDKVTEAINKHFKYVSFKFWDKQVNGDMKPVCIPMIDGFEFGSSTNTGREILAKIDIVNGLQNFYDVHLPIIIDGGEALSKDTVSKIDVDTQLVITVVSENENLTIG